MHLDEHVSEHGFLRIRVYFRHRNGTRYQLFISYKINDCNDNEIDDNENDDNENDDNTPIKGYYCTCQSGCRTLGSCAHIASIVWFLGYARHRQNIKYPTSYLLNRTLDAAEREQANQANGNNDFVEVGNVED